jgi:mono/diheme cytochrome c family protein
MRALVIALLMAALALAAGGAFVASGAYDVSATDPHLPPTNWLIEQTMRRAVARRGGAIQPPPPGGRAQLERGLALFRAHCVTCHGAPGVAPEAFALGLMPLPAPLVQTGREWRPAEVFWVVKYGLKMTGMPAWQFRLSDEEIWAVVAFVAELPRLSPSEYRAMTAGDLRRAPAELPGAPDPERGRTALHQYACVACHEIPGVTAPKARVGPPLAGIGARRMLGGVLPHTPENLVRWLRTPQSFDPPTAMPDLGVSERDARDMAAYLGTLK